MKELNMMTRIVLVGWMVLTCTISQAQGEEVSLRREVQYRLPLTHEFRSEGVTVRNKKGDSGKADIRTQVVCRVDGDRHEIEAKMWLEKVDIDDVRVSIFVEIVNLPRGISIWSEDEDLRADAGENDDGGFKRRIREKEILEATHLVISHVPVEWRNPGENDPGPIDVATGRTHVIIVPGLLGDTSSVKDVEKFLETLKDPEGGQISAQIWDWTRLWIKPRGLQAQVLINQQTRDIGNMLATRLVEWKAAQKTREEKEKIPAAKTVHIVGLSAGTLITATACEAKRVDGNPILGDKFFGHVLFLSGVLSVRHDLTDIQRCSEGIYNYYSDKDDTLTAAFPRIFMVFELDVSVSWPAVGRFGYSQKDAEYSRVTSQLPWLRKDYGGKAEGFGNNGRHLSPGCLKEEYFREYIAPLFTQKLLPPAPLGREWWSKNLHPCYEQDQSKDPAACKPKEADDEDD